MAGRSIVAKETKLLFQRVLPRNRSCRRATPGILALSGEKLVRRLPLGFKLWQVSLTVSSHRAEAT